ncbi:hypothetical protein GE21DRAFT_3967 [Neurospora crassa]|uniref:Uncharacterized protein n=1 Tax=Neurospora crassa (strain ATCC 24698 / 74-OR23-1A / CBS 708.71 / DSM 1257 / FGSC 987) TaxID=367110 RepID=Q7SAR7_NEUCR|nr:hypothetical protein NCU07841 [Neurospora crassa OR74A]EAA33486.1 hypothetical protein NCU07841 [Neurospora crassa OR74A]KHE84669.1 hypothetical protein GE21DRAFT_3967 [Neurospora crassa]|eukprot:XP_962722.1 hypothetical protein NCU07841 [Neurospora crassa OR74A]
MAGPDLPRQLPVRPRTPRHIVDAMEAPGMGKPLPALPIATLAFPPLAIPLSSFAIHSQRSSKRRFQIRCSHSVMTRFYSTGDKCALCRRKGDFGWVYRCIVDRDALIMGKQANGIPVAFDGIGCRFAEKMTLGKHGPEARHEDYSFLREITPEQMVSYTPSQIQKILSQRENVKNTIAEERHQFDHPRYKHAKKRFPDDDQPWMPSRETECSFTVCHNCCPSATEKNRISIDSVVEDDIQPTVAVGYGFSKLKSRPYAKAEIVRNIGYRPVPMPIERSGQHSANAWLSTQSNEALDIADQYLGMAAHDGSSDAGNVITPVLPYRLSPPGTHPHSQCMVGSSTDTFDFAYANGSFASNFLHVRPPWTPPPTPRNTPEDGINESETLPTFDTCYLVCNGRSPASLEVSPAMRNMAFSSVTDLPVSERQRGTESTLAEPCPEFLDEDQIPMQFEERYNPSPIQTLKSKVYVEACTTPLPRPNMDEIMFFSNRALPRKPNLGRHRSQCEFGRGARPLTPISVAGQDKKVMKSLSSEPITFLKGIAITEEAAEFGTPDVSVAVDVQPPTSAYPKQGGKALKF